MPTVCQFVLENFHAIHMKNRRAAKTMIQFTWMVNTLSRWKFCYLFCGNSVCVGVLRSWLIKHLLRGNSQRANRKSTSLQHVHALFPCQIEVCMCMRVCGQLHPHLVKMCDYVIRMLSSAFVLLRVHTNTLALPNKQINISEEIMCWYRGISFTMNELLFSPRICINWLTSISQLSLFISQSNWGRNRVDGISRRKSFQFKRFCYYLDIWDMSHMSCLCANLCH